MTTESMVSITVEEYESLLKDSHFLVCLENNGVDNWNGYGEAREEHEDFDPSIESCYQI